MPPPLCRVCRSEGRHRRGLSHACAERQHQRCGSPCTAMSRWPRLTTASRLTSTSLPVSSLPTPQKPSLRRPFLAVRIRPPRTTPRDAMTMHREGSLPDALQASASAASAGSSVFIWWQPTSSIIPAMVRAGRLLACAWSDITGGGGR